MRYTVTAERPTYACGSELADFARGDVLDVLNTRPDRDGDVWARRVSDGEEGHVMFAHLAPAEALDVRAVRAALAAKNVADADEIVRLAQAIAAAL